MPSVFLDTSDVIALLKLDDPHHTNAEAWFRIVRRRRWPLLTTTAILVEIGDGFAQKGRWDLAEPFGLAVFVDPTVELVPVEASLTRRAIDLKQRRGDKRWSLTDCISFTVMDDRAVRHALTADSDFQQAGYRALLLEPADERAVD